MHQACCFFTSSHVLVPGNVSILLLSQAKEVKALPVFILMPHDKEPEVHQILRESQNAVRVIQIWAISR